MKNYILLLAVPLLLLPLFAKAQIQYPTGLVYDSTTFTFSNNDSLIHKIHIDPFISTNFVTVTIDTSSTILWRIGNTLKPVFSNGTIVTRAIMTDTLHPYPKHANDFFVLKIDFLPNFIVDFWHRYETDSLHAGGIVEYSTDTGTSWLNIADCNWVNTEGFYSQTDTILSGQHAFTGVSHGEQLSRLQFLNCIGVKLTTTTCVPEYGYNGPVYIRFRFESDSTTDSLSGWIIDSIKIENPGCIPGYVSKLNKQAIIDLSPNPTTTALHITSTDKITNVAISNLLGQTVYSNAYNAAQIQINVADLPTGLYFVKINGTEVRKFVKE